MSTVDIHHQLTNVMHEGNRVTITNVKPFSPADYASSTHGAQLTTMHALGETVTYAQFIGADGLAFRMQMHKALCPSSPHACCGHECVKSGMSLPWKFDLIEFHNVKQGTPEYEARRKQVQEAVRANIDKGIPVPFGSFEDGVIIGYEADGEKWLCTHPYHKWGKEPFIYGESGHDMVDEAWPFGFVLFTRPKTAAELTPMRTLATNAMREAVAMWNEGWSGDYAMGDNAYRVWLDWLKAVESGEIADPKPAMQGNGWVFDSLSGYRQAASAFLREAAAEFDHSVQPHMTRAADAYDAMVAALTQGIDCPWSLTKDPGKADEWTSELRCDQIRRVEAAREHDRKAIEAIEAALNSLDAEAG